MTPQDETIRQLTAERDCYKELVERAAICQAMMHWGTVACVGKRTNVGAYVYEIGFDGDDYTATLVVEGGII
jgi:hypothetical protein